MIKNILHIDSSCSLSPSTSREVSKKVVEKFTQKTNTRVTYRDIGATPVPHIDHMLVESFYRKGILSDKAIEAGQRSKELIEEFLEHDLIVLGVPMYNFTIPSTLKSYIDHITRPGYTFNFTENGYKGLVKNKRCIVVITRASKLSGSEHNHQETYLKTIFSFLGIEDYKFIIIEGLSDLNNRKMAFEKIDRQLEQICL